MRFFFGFPFRFVCEDPDADSPSALVEEFDRAVLATDFLEREPVPAAGQLHPFRGEQVKEASPPVLGVTVGKHHPFPGDCGRSGAEADDTACNRPSHRETSFPHCPVLRSPTKSLPPAKMPGKHVQWASNDVNEISEE